jgi:hypothetical protein
MQLYKCPNCGGEWPDNYCTACARTIDRTLLPQPPPEKIELAAKENGALASPVAVPSKEDRRSGISARRKVTLWLAAWTVAMVATQVPLPFALWAPGTFLLFPVGLFRCLLPSSFTPSDYNLAAALGWPVYFALTMAALLQSRRTRYFVVYGILCVLLATNVVGCQLEAHRPWKM